MQGKTSPPNFPETGAPDRDASRLDTSSSAWCSVPALILYLVLSILFIPLAGIQNDEALFAVAIFKGMTRDLRLFHHSLQLMVMSYLGTVKTLLWWPILRVFGGSVWTLRLPAVLLSTATIYFFYRFMRFARIPATAAAAALWLLASDPSFLLTNTYDWGPVALEHFLLTLALLALLRYSQEPARNWLLFIGFFCLGLALWNKAIFLWSLAGLGIGSLAVFRTELLAHLGKRTARIAALAFVLGSAPLIFYNIRHHNATLGQNAQIEPASAAFAKWQGMKAALNGNGLFGYLTEEEWNEHPKPLSSRFATLSESLRNLAGQRRDSELYYFYLLLILLVPLWWRSRAAWFSLIFCSVTWLSMAVTHDAGSSLHHTVLLWPVLVLFAAAVFERLGRGAWLPTTAAVVLNLLVLNQYVYLLEKFGTARDFSDAIFRLADSPEVHSGKVLWVTDWGMFNSLVLLTSGHADLRTGNEPFMSDQMNEVNVKQALSMTHPGDLFIDHVAGKEVFEGVRKRFDAYMRTQGFQAESVQTIPDSNGRPVFEIFRLRPL